MRYAPIVLILTLFAETRALGQDAVIPGERVKIRAADPSQTIVGTVQAIFADRIDLVEGTSVSRSNMRTIHRSIGMGRCTKRGAAIGSIAGLVLGLFGKACDAACACSLPEPECGPCRDTCGVDVEGTLFGAATGAGYGALIGFFFKRERWKEVQLSITTFQVSSHGKVSPALNLTWAW